MRKDIYIVVKEMGITEFTFEVNKKIAEGYKVIQGFTHVRRSDYHSEYIQPMMLKSTLEENNKLK